MLLAAPKLGIAHRGVCARTTAAPSSVKAAGVVEANGHRRVVMRLYCDMMSPVPFCITTSALCAARVAIVQRANESDLSFSGVSLLFE